MNKNLFKSGGVQASNCVNEAGGKAYSLSDEAAFAQYLVTGCLNDTFYASADDQMAKVQALAASCSSDFLAKCAVYGHEVAKMKDMPAYCLAVLTARYENDLLRKTFPRVVTNSKMLTNYVQMIRSGVTGRKSFGTVAKNLISDWITAKNGDQLFNASVGVSAPSLEDVIKMVHPKAKNPEQNAIIGYLLGKEHSVDNLPVRVQQYEAFKKNPVGEVPSVDFRLLSNLTLSEDNWKALAKTMSWNQLRMNLNTLGRHNVFNDKSCVEAVAAKLRDEKEVVKNNAFPYQLMTTFNNAEVPSEISNALHDAMEIATRNVGKIGDGSVTVCVDISGSMDNPVTGYRPGATTVTTCRDVAALVGSVVLRNNDNGKVIAFHTDAIEAKLNARDSVMTNSKKLRELPSGGTDCACAMRLMNDNNYDSKVVIFVSDNMSWIDYYGSGYSASSRGTGLAHEWSKYKARVKGAKLILIDIQPYSSTQVSDSKDVLNIGGWSDSAFEVIQKFLNNEGGHFVETISATVL